MQIRSELTALSPQRLTWKFQQSGDNVSKNPPAAGAVRLTGLRAAQREALKENRVEKWVWIGLAFTSLAILAISFWPIT